MTPAEQTNPQPCVVTLFLCGDVMTGRGIDQILPHPNSPQLYEPYVSSALDYVKLAERAGGLIQRPVDLPYIWGEALTEFERARPDIRIVNLETAVTSNGDPWPGKGIHYRMHPANVACLTMAKLDCCVLANNHVLDWGHGGLLETLTTLRAAGIHTAGAGRDEAEARAPAVIEVRYKARVLVFALATEDSGVPRNWAATKDRAGVNLLPDLSARSAETIVEQVRRVKHAGDIVVLSIHWGGNWGFTIELAQRAFAHRLIDAGAVDVVHGHSSHHVKGVELYRDRPILYGCGDFLNDYEGIGGHEAYRADLSLMYFPTLDVVTGRLNSFSLTPTSIRRLRVSRAPDEGSQWLVDTLNREGRPLGTRVEREADHRFKLLRA